MSSDVDYTNDVERAELLKRLRDRWLGRATETDDASNTPAAVDDLHAPPQYSVALARQYQRAQEVTRANRW